MATGLILITCAFQVSADRKFPPARDTALTESVQARESTPFSQLRDSLRGARSQLTQAQQLPDKQHARRIRDLGRRLEILEAALERLPSLPEPQRAALRRQLDALTAQIATVLDSIPPFNLGLGIAPRAVEEFGIRVEPDLGTPSCTDASREANSEFCLEGPWLSTRSPNFINIKRTAFFRGSFQQTGGNQVSSSFVAERDGTQVAFHFSAEAYVDDDSSGANRRMFVRALVDGVPVAPQNVVFAVGSEQSPRSMLFSTTVDAGIHTVEMQWLVDRGGTAFLRNASLLVRTGPAISQNGTLVAHTEAGGVTPPSTSSNAWQDIPGMARWIYVPPNGMLTASLGGETSVEGAGDLAMVVRALVDGVPLDPSDVVFRRGARIQSHAYTFGTRNIASGWHRVRFQWFAEVGATATMADRTMVLAAYPSTTANASHIFVSPPSGPNLETSSGSFQPVPGLSTTINIGPRGNGEVAAIVSAEVFANGGASTTLALAVDGTVQSEVTTRYTDGQEAAQAKAFQFDAKRLAPGNHTIAVYWRADDGGTAGMGDRSMALLSEKGLIPDLAEALPLSPARYTQVNGGQVDPVEDNVVGLEPMIGSRKVLAILWDPLRDDVTPAPAGDVSDRIFGATDSADDYFREASGGRFQLQNAGVLGWFPSTLGDDYTVPKPFCIDGYINRQIEKRADAIQQADPFFDFSAHDTNEDGFLEWNELAIIIVIAQNSDFGTARARLTDPACGGGPFIVDGVEIPDVTEWFTDAEPADFVVAAHELAHQIFGLDDIYQSGTSSAKAREVVGPWQFSLMSARAESGDGAQGTSPHPGPFHKLALGWVTPVTVHAGATYFLQDVKLGDRVLVLPHYNNEARDDEYFLLENRRSNTPGFYDQGLGDSGIGIWHIVSDRADNGNSPRGVPDDQWLPFGIQDTQARRSIRLLRRFISYDPSSDNADANQNNPLWDMFATSELLSGPCNSLSEENVAAWGDCTPSGYDIRMLTPSGEFMAIDIDVN
ncbi:hypothetical protein [Microbulbifer taiwanensis]|nr:hypothetical protein [Microbulbifer taiwanensis]